VGAFHIAISFGSDHDRLGNNASKVCACPPTRLSAMMESKIAASGKHDGPSPQSFLRYRDYLKAYFDHQKKTSRHFSHAFFARRAGFKSRTFILKVMKGEKSLSRASVYQVAVALGLGKKDQDYFNLLVLFNDAKTMEERAFFFNQLQSLNKDSRSVLLVNDQYQYFNHWYNPVIREIAAYSDFQDDYKKLAGMVFPRITAKQAKESVELLLRLGLLEKKGGRFVQTDTVVTTGDEVYSIAVRNFQKENLRLASEALEKLGDEKEISTITFGTNLEGYRQVKREIIAFRKRLLSLMANHLDLDRVYQLNFQLFPLSDLKEKKSP
jgi:uncharacterized protein (TIGR02147 family)